jgi:hypothetical protein
VDREWNRQQVQFQVPGPQVEVTGGDGFEVCNLSGASLAKNCLNAGLWEVLLSVKEDGKKAMYYQGWFTFPLGLYKQIWEQNTGLSYFHDDHYWYRMEHWLDPTGTPINLCRLRTVQSVAAIDARFCRSERILYDGEQIRKTRTTNMPNQRTWGEILCCRNATFATFKSPGLYDVDKPWKNEYWRLARFHGAVVRGVDCPARPGQVLHEIELTFHPDRKGSGHETCDDLGCKAGNCSRDRGALTRIFIGGIDLESLPVLPVYNYSKGLYMPMGIAVPPFYQTYEELRINPPTDSPYYSFILNEKDEWLDHHSIAIDGPVMHRDVNDPDMVHLYLLSYERHTLVAHFVLPIAGGSAVRQDLETATPQSPPERVMPPSPAPPAAQDGPVIEGDTNERAGAR